MFAVPGWNVASKRLVQESAKPVKVKPTRSSTDAISSASNSQPGARKRKRDHDSNTEISRSPGSEKHAYTQGPRSNRPQGQKPNNGGKQEKQHRSKTRKKEKSTGANTEPVIPRESRRENHNEKQAGRNSKQNHDQHTKTPGKDNKVSRTDDVQDALTHLLPPIPAAPSHLTPLQAKMRAKLTAARFRHLNETLYTTPSNDALKLFANSPDLFQEYHAGFAQQVKDSWPENPVNIYLRALQTRGKANSPVMGVTPLPRRRPGVCTIADLGCGDAPLARGLQNVSAKLNLKLHSFDLHAANDMVTVADISALPLPDGSADIAIFCLSLMGTNWLTFVEEAWRILRGDGKGEVWVAEVKSRFGRASARKGPGHVVENSVGKRRKAQGQSKEADDGANDTSAFVELDASAASLSNDDDTDLDPFVQSFQRRGFMLQQGSVDKSNKMFVSMIFKKTGVPRAGKWKGMLWNGKEYQPQSDRKSGAQPRFTGAKFTSATEDEIDEEAEGKLLKPCVYKLR